MAGKYDAKVRAGCEFLDEHVSGWDARIDLELLDLSDCAVCVVGQLIGDDDVAHRGLYALTPALEAGMFPSGFGFSLGEQGGTYHGLTRAWKRAITARREEAGRAALAEGTGDAG